MDKFWKWLMKADAKGLFATSIVVLAGVLAWCAIDQVRSAREPRDETTHPSADNAARSSYVPLGILDFIDRQFAPETLIVPVNPFHPTFEEIVRSIMEKSESGEIEIIDENGNRIKVHFDGNDLVDKDGRKIVSPFQRDLTPKTPNLAGQRTAGGQASAKSSSGSKPPPPPPKPKPGHGRTLRYSGLMQRPDGQFAAYVMIHREEDDKSAGRFVAVGDDVEGTAVKAVGRDSIEISIRGGEPVTLRIGDAPVKIR